MNLMNISRRSFVTSTAAGLGALATKGKADYLHDEFVEALVIGSGFGGAIAALRLAEAGVRTVVRSEVSDIVLLLPVILSLHSRSRTAARLG